MYDVHISLFKALLRRDLFGCTEASRVNTMHRAISVLSRKARAATHDSNLNGRFPSEVDNLTTTLRVCREHYYKDTGNTVATV